MRHLCWIATITILYSGCTSFRTTVMQRCPNGMFHTNVVEKTKGIPVKLKVPTHVEVVVTEDFFIEKNHGFHEIPIKNGDAQIRSMNVSTKVIYTDKVFTVDFKRPAGGSLTLGTESTPGVSFDDEQYFSKIRAAYTEQTLADINTAIGTLKPSLSSAKKQSTNDAKTANLGIQDREVARARFDISDPCWEAQLHEFVDLHVTCCYQGCRYDN